MIASTKLLGCNLLLELLGAANLRAINGHTFKHIHCALSQSLVDINPVLLLRSYLLLALLRLPLHHGKRACCVSLRRYQARIARLVRCGYFGLIWSIGSLHDQ